MGTLIRSGKLKITEVFSHARLREVTSAELRLLDRELLSFLNLNTPEDLGKVAARL